MIFGIGTDIVEISRIERAYNKNANFAARILTAVELEDMQSRAEPIRFLAKRFAVKEAIVKAMGTGIGNGMSWQMMQIDHSNLGQPQLQVYSAIEEFFNNNQIAHYHLSIADEKSYACAMAVLEK